MELKIPSILLRTHPFTSNLRYHWLEIIWLVCCFGENTFSMIYMLRFANILMYKYESNALLAPNCISLAAILTLLSPFLVFLFLVWSDVFLSILCICYSSTRLLAVWMSSCDHVTLDICYPCYSVCWMSYVLLCWFMISNCLY